MHIPDGFIPLLQCAVYWIIAIIFLIFAFKWGRKMLKSLKRDNRARPALWLFCAFCVSAICFWLPFLLSSFSGDPYVSRRMTGIEIHYLPISLLASFTALCFYIVLWRRTPERREAFSVRLLLVGLVLCLVTLGPVLLVAFCFIAAICFR